MPNQGEFCFISMQYYVDFPDRYLMTHDDGGKKRPFFFVFEDSLHKGIFWLVPISRVDNKNNKYQREIARKMQRYGVCDTIVLGRVLGQNAAFLIQNMCPVTQKYIESVYVQKSTGSIVAVDKITEQTVIRSARKVWAQVKKGYKLVWPDIIKIYEVLASDIGDDQK
mgnify:CR=1 FL=1